MTATSTWTRWPHSAATAESVDDTQEKRAELEYSDQSPEYMLRGLVDQLPEWELELPIGVAKTAALRLGTEEELPAVTPKNIWRHPNAHPLVLALLLLDRYGNDYVTWEPEALRQTLRKDNVAISESVWTKILAGRVVMASGSPWRQWDQFHWVTTGLAGRSPNFVYMERPEIGFIMSGVDTMKAMDKTRPFAEDVAKFVAAVFRDQSIPYAPSPLQFAQEEIDDRHILCGQCGTKEKDDHDIKCVACGSKDLKRIPGVYEDLRDKTKTKYEARRRMPLEKAVEGLSEQVAEDSAAYRLLVHNEYKNQVRAQLVAQLRMLK